MKLSKREQKKCDEALKLLSKESLSHEEIEFVYDNLNEGALGDVTGNSAFFTGLPLAYDFSLMAPIAGVVCDMCSGFGVLAFTALVRDSYENSIKKMICIERNPKYIDIGKKLVKSHRNNTEVIWIEGDIFNEQLWLDIEKEHGKIDCLISNPPFGKVSKTDYSRDWLKYKGSDLDIAALEIGLKVATHASYILPQGSCTFRGSGRPWFEHVENRKIDKLKKETGLDFYMSWLSIDTTAYEQNFKNTTIIVECCTLDKEY
jgi:hypothetical protein